MIQTVQTGSPPSIERSPELEVFISEENVVDGISDAPTTCTSAPGVATSLTARCWSAVRDGVLAVWKSLVGMTTWVWNCAILLVHKRTTVERVNDFRESVEKFNCCKTSEGEDREAALSLVIATYDALSDPVKNKLIQRLQNASEMTVEEASNMMFVSQYADICLEAVIFYGLYKYLPSVILGDLEAAFFKATDDRKRLAVLEEMQNIEISDFEPELTADILDKHILILFDRLNDSLKDDIYTETRLQALALSSYSTKLADSGSVIFRQAPCSRAAKKGVWDVWETKRGD